MIKIPRHIFVTIVTGIGLLLICSSLWLYADKSGNRQHSEALPIDIKIRNYEFYLFFSVYDEYERQQNLLDPYVYVVDKKYYDLRISKEDALSLGVTEDFYDLTMDSYKSIKENPPAWANTDMMAQIERHYEAIRNGDLRPGESTQSFKTKIPSIRKRSQNETP